jgi:hypothetical protein
VPTPAPAPVTSTDGPSRNQTPPAEQSPVNTPSPAPAPATTFLPPALQSTISNSVVAATTGFAAPTGLAVTGARLPVTETITDSSRTTPVNLTQGGGSSFQVVVAPSSGLGGEGLVLNRGISDQVVQSASRVEISIPPDAFAHTNPNASVQLSAQQANGQPLPNWMAFDGRSGKFIVDAPPGVRGEVSIKVVARDSEGHEVVSVFKVRVGTQAQGQGSGQGQQPSRQAPGRASLSEQLHVAARHAHGGGVLERLARIAEAAKPGDA